MDLAAVTAVRAARHYRVCCWQEGEAGGRARIYPTSSGLNCQATSGNWSTRQSDARDSELTSAADELRHGQVFLFRLYVWC